MSPLLESILLKKGTFPLLPWHQARFDSSRRKLFANPKPIDLKSVLDPKNSSRHGLTKCRLVYGPEIIKIEYLPYQIKPIRSLRMIQDDDIEYPYKWMDRSALDHLYQQRQEADDILIIKEGLITDSYYANVALLKQGVWYTPSRPLLLGVRRQFLLESKQIVPAGISVQSLFEYERIRLFNAMIAWDDALDIDVDNILG